MIFERLQHHAEQRPDAPLFLGALTYAQALEQVLARVEAWPLARGARVALSPGSTVQGALAVLALDALGARAHLLPGHLSDDAVERVLAALDLDGRIVEGAYVGEAAATPVERGEVVLFTSGTTGLPKASLHTWQSLSGRVHHADNLRDARWGLTYGFPTFAGQQVFLHALDNGGAFCFRADTPAAMAARCRNLGVTHVSGTPTFYRVMLATAGADVLADWHPRQLTLGGEAVDQGVLDALGQRFPEARRTHIYASTEAGVGFPVHDGKAGFPAHYLDDPTLPALLRVVDGELRIKSPYGMKSYLTANARYDDDGYFRTGDRVEVKDDRVWFLGRDEERINVGGNKVYPREVETVILEVPGVRLCRVSGKKSSMVGELVTAEVVAEPGVDVKALRTAVAQHTRDRLRPYQVPRLVRVVDSLQISHAGKVVRHTQE